MIYETQPPTKLPVDFLTRKLFPLLSLPGRAMNLATKRCVLLFAWQNRQFSPRVPTRRNFSVLNNSRVYFNFTAASSHSSAAACTTILWKGGKGWRGRESLLLQLSLCSRDERSRLRQLPFSPTGPTIFLDWMGKKRTLDWHQEEKMRHEESGKKIYNRMGDRLVSTLNPGINMHGNVDVEGCRF